MKPTAKIDRMRGRILAQDNRFCFIEREEILRECAEESLRLPLSERYVFEFTRLLERLSVPADSEDVFGGRFLEALWPHGNQAFSRVPGGVSSEGHITFCWGRILNGGLCSLLKEVEAAASADPSFNTRFFAEGARKCLTAVDAYAKRYAEAFRKKRMTRVAKALSVVPFRPAYDFFSALQSVWFWQMITSGVCGARDFALGHLDQSLFPFYEKDRKSGKLTRREAVELLAMFFLKLNELAGTATDDFMGKPTPCHASKQYVTLRGDRRNDLTERIVEASLLCGLSQPTLNFLLSANQPESAWHCAGKAASLPSIPNFFNRDLIRNTLLRGGISPAAADSFDITDCNRVNLPGKLSNIMRRIDHFDNSCAWFVEALHRFGKEEKNAPGSVRDLLSALKGIALREMRDYAKTMDSIFSDGPAFSIDSLAVDSCRAHARDKLQGGADAYRWQHHIFSGLATLTDSLCAIDEMVFKTGRFSYGEFLEIVDSDFRNREPLRQELRSKCPKFGNDDPRADAVARVVADTLLDAMEEVGRLTHFQMFASFYSLGRHLSFGRELPATPDGRHAGEPISENQSPVYGTDQAGPTALLRSVASLPLDRTVCGGLNLKLGSVPSSDRLESLLRSFFQMGGLHLGFTMTSRETLEKARLHPESYRTLCIRKYGFSEYFVSLSPEFQQEIIDRTEY